MVDFDLLKKIINENNSFLLTTHVNPDADAIGSELAFNFLLKKLDKKVYVINHSETPYNLKFLDAQNIIEKYDESRHAQIANAVDVVIVIDLNQLNRLVSMEKVIGNSNTKKICIDHHQEPGGFADYCFVDSSLSATGELIYDFITFTKIVELTYEIAVQLYAAIMTDTGSFRFERTTPKIHMIASELLQKGVNPTAVYDAIYEQGKRSRLILLGDALRSISLNKNGEISYMIVTQDDLKKTEADEADIDGFVNYCLSIVGVKIGILFFELKDGVKISFRSKGNVQVNKLAAEFGGGGHNNASGARLYNVSLNELLPKVFSAAEKYL